MSQLIENIKENVRENWFDRSIRSSKQVRRHNQDPMYYTGLTKYVVDTFPAIKELSDDELSAFMTHSPLLEDIASNVLLERYNMGNKSTFTESNRYQNQALSFLVINVPIERPDILRRIFPKYRAMRIKNFPIEELDHSYFEAFSDLKILQINNQSIKSIHTKAFEPLDVLENLSISRTQISTLNNSLVSLKSLNRLVISYNDSFCKFPQLPETRHLEYLMINNNSRNQDPSSGIPLVNLTFLDNLPKIKEINLSSNNIQEFQQLEKLNGSNLEKIQLGHNPANIMESSTVFQNMSKLTDLTISVSKDVIPSDFLETCSNLQKLHIFGNEQLEIEDGFLEKNSKLQIILINNTGVNSIPKSVLKGKKLQNLTLAHNQLEDFNLKYLNTQALRYLDIRGNNFDNSVRQKLSRKINQINRDRNYRMQINFKY